MEFKQSVIESLGYYVYCLLDPRDKKIFYIGKGNGNRVFQHAKAALTEDTENLKLDTIRNILDSGYNIEHYIIRHNLTEETAYTVESTLIDFLSYPKFNKELILTNIQAGHHMWDEGIKSIKEINLTYDCEKIVVNENDRLLLVSLNKSFDQTKSKGTYVRPNLYEATRKYWKIDNRWLYKIQYILGIYKNIVRIVIKPDKDEWVKVKKPSEFDGVRYACKGEVIPKSPYLNKDVSDYPFNQRSTLFIPKEPWKTWK